jgi:hypothetical protein
VILSIINSFLLLEFAGLYMSLGEYGRRYHMSINSNVDKLIACNSKLWFRIPTEKCLGFSLTIHGNGEPRLAAVTSNQEVRCLIFRFIPHLTN